MEGVQIRQNIHIHFSKIYFKIIPQLMDVGLSCSRLPTTVDFLSKYRLSTNVYPDYNKTLQWILEMELKVRLQCITCRKKV
jgi:hypothetical protein